jgi:flagellar protein FlbT
MYLADDPAPAEDLFMAQANELMAAVPSTAPYIRDIHAEIETKNFYRALKRGKDLVQYEASLAERLANSPDAGLNESA